MLASIILFLEKSDIRSGAGELAEGEVGMPRQPGHEHPALGGHRFTAAKFQAGRVAPLQMPGSGGSSIEETIYQVEHFFAAVVDPNQLLRQDYAPEWLDSSSGSLDYLPGTHGVHICKFDISLLRAIDALYDICF